MTDVPLPRRARCPWLPSLHRVVRDQPGWVFGAHGMRGLARLRVWETSDGGMFAVVTESGRGLSVTNAQPDLWALLASRYGDGCPFGMAELWPEKTGASDELHVDAVLPARGPLPLEWARVHPVSPANPRAELFGAWWAVNGDEILAR